MKPCALIVDDEPYICNVVGAYLQENGYRVLTATDLTAARAHLDQVLPDIMILDVMLNQSNGVQFLKEIRTHAQFKDLPVILMSALMIKPNQRVAGLEVGADDYMCKPFDLRELKIRMEKILSRSGKIKREAGEELEKILKNNQSSIHVEAVLADALKDLSSKTLSPKKNVLSKESPAAVQAHDSKPTSSAPQINPLVRLGKEFVDLLISPNEFLNYWKSKQDLWLSILLPGILGILWGAQKGWEVRSSGVAFNMILVGSLTTYGSTFVLAWIIHWGLGLRQISVSLKKLFETLALAWAPMVMGALLGLLYVGFAQGRTGDFTLSPLLAFPSQIPSSLTGFFLRHLDVFEIWSVLLAARSLSEAFGWSRKNIYGWAIGLWFLSLCSYQVIRSFL